MSWCMRSRRSSGTLQTPMLDFPVLKAKLVIWALVFDMQLNRVVLPELVMPTIPHFKLIRQGMKS